MKKIFSFLFTIICLQVPAQKNTTVNTQSFKQPRLVVGIVVDQMRVDYIYRYWNLLGNNGFKLLLRDGFECKNTQYNYMPTYTGPGHASIFTGTTPNIHGIIGNTWFDRKADSVIYCVTDINENCVGCDNKNGKMSPVNLLTTTVGDELRMFSSMKSKVIGVSLKDRSSIFPAGHAANAAYWFDNISGNFVSSTHYITQLPAWVVDFNNAKYPDKYLSQPWNLLYSSNQYADTVDNSIFERPYSGEAAPVFPHDLAKIKTTAGYDLIRKVPFGNTLTKDFAVATIKGEGLGADNITDLLTLSFSATDYVGHQFGTNALETEDTYLRLDRDLADLLQFLNKEFGKENILVFLTADHAALPNPEYLKAHKIPSGWTDEIAIARTIKSFLKNEYGDSSIFNKYVNDQVYLNHTKLNDKKINLVEIQSKLAEFLVGKFDIADAITAEKLNTSEFTKAPRSLTQLGYNRNRSGDIALIFEPGIIESLLGDHTGTTHGSPYNYDTQVPLLWYGWSIKQGSTTRKINITDIAPTVSTFLHIGFPSGCSGNVIEELFK